MNERAVIESALAEDFKAQFGAGKEEGEQGTITWLMERCGHATASRFRDILDFTKAGKPGAKRTAYLWELVCERLTGKPAQHYESVAMQHGTEQEPIARMAFEAQSGCIVAETGFLKHPERQWIGGSPDGLVDDDGGLEIKAPFNSANHLQTWLNGMPPEHMAQVQGLMWITGRDYWWFCSYDSRMPAELQLYAERIDRDGEYIANLAMQADTFLAEVADILSRLKAVTAAERAGQ